MAFTRRLFTLLTASLSSLFFRTPPAAEAVRPSWVPRYSRLHGKVWRPDTIMELAEMLADDLAGAKDKHDVAVAQKARPAGLLVISFLGS